MLPNLVADDAADYSTAHGSDGTPTSQYCAADRACTDYSDFWPTRGAHRGIAPSVESCPRLAAGVFRSRGIPMYFDASR